MTTQTDCLHENETIIKVIDSGKRFTHKTLDGVRYMIFHLSNGGMIAIKEITPSDVLAKVSDKQQRVINTLFNEYVEEENQEGLNEQLKAIYKTILKDMADAFVVYVDREHNTHLYRAQFKRNCYVNVRHPITGKSVNINNLIANLKAGYLIPPKEHKKLVGDHIDQNKYNNSYDNIRLLTQKENNKNKGNKYVFIQVFEQLMNA